MELSDPIDAEKKKLREASNLQCAEFEKEITRLLGSSKQYLTNAVIMVGTVVLAYSIINGFLSKKNTTRKTTKKGVTTQESSYKEAKSLLKNIGSSVVNESLLLILDLVRERLSEYIENKRLEGRK